MTSNKTDYLLLLCVMSNSDFFHLLSSISAFNFIFFLLWIIKEKSSGACVLILIAPFWTMRFESLLSLQCQQWFYGMNMCLLSTNSHSMEIVEYDPCTYLKWFQEVSSMLNGFSQLRDAVAINQWMHLQCDANKWVHHVPLKIDSPHHSLSLMIFSFFLLLHILFSPLCNNFSKAIFIHWSISSKHTATCKSVVIFLHHVFHFNYSRCIKFFHCISLTFFYHVCAYT